MQGAGGINSKCKGREAGRSWSVLETARRPVWLKIGELRGEW